MKYTVLLQKDKNGYVASVPVLPGCQTRASTEQEAIDSIRTQVSELLSQAKLISVEVDTPPGEGSVHPWSPFAGMWRDDPGFDDFLHEMEATRSAESQ